MSISPHFKRKEFACHCGCGFEAVDVELLCVLEDIRQYFGKLPLHINSACRCERHNKSIKGAKESKHVRGIAADIWIEQIEPEDVANYLDEKYPNKYGIGRYCDFTHVDMRNRKARWDKK